MASLQEWMDDHPGVGPRCVTCRLPREILDDLNAGLRDDVKPMVIMAWLKDEGYVISKDSLYNHKDNQHFVETKS